MYICSNGLKLLLPLLHLLFSGLSLHPHLYYFLVSSRCEVVVYSTICQQTRLCWCQLRGLCVVVVVVVVVVIVVVVGAAVVDVVDVVVVVVVVVVVGVGVVSVVVVIVVVVIVVVVLDVQVEENIEMSGFPGNGV